jgi:hypothetical protein
VRHTIDWEVDFEMRPARVWWLAGPLLLGLLLTACWPVGGSQAASQDTCSRPPTAVVQVGSERPLPVTRAMKMTVSVGQTVAVTYSGPCARGGRLTPSKAGPGEGLNEFISPANWTWSRTQTWTPTEPGLHNLMVGWSCTGPMSCPAGWLGIITVTTSAAEG